MIYIAVAAVYLNAVKNLTCAETDSEKKVGKKWAQAGFEPVYIAWKSQSLTTRPYGQ